jgi:hypothetical protein
LKTIEPAKFKVCAKCGLSSTDTIGDPPRCSMVAKCGIGKPGRPATFGGPVWGGGREPKVPDLTEDDHAEIRRAIEARRAKAE